MSQPTVQQKNRRLLFILIAFALSLFAIVLKFILVK